MNKTLLLGLIGASFLISGCTVQPSNKHDFIKYDNKSQIIGNKNNYIKKITYEKGIDKKIIFYVDKFPYKKDFNLCDKKDFIKRLTKTHKNSKYHQDNKSCQSHIYVNKNDRLPYPYTASMNFQFLDGVEYVKQYNSFLDSKSKYFNSSLSFKEGKNNIDTANKIYLSIEN